MFALVYKMQYFLRKVAGGYKTCDKKHCFSKNPLTLDRARKQRIAIALSEHRANPSKPINYYFK